MHAGLRLTFSLLFFVTLPFVSVSGGEAANDFPRPLGTLVISSDACRAVSGASPNVKDGHASYVPGVDAYGRPVIPADGGGSGTDNWSELLLKDVRIDLTVDLARRLGMGGNTGSESWFDFFPETPSAREDFGAKAFVAEITFSDGEVRVNGKLLPSTSHSHLEAICRKSVSGK